jgi:hypothetical protein
MVSQASISSGSKGKRRFRPFFTEQVRPRCDADDGTPRENAAPRQRQDGVAASNCLGTSLDREADELRDSLPDRMATGELPCHRLPKIS